MRRAAYFELREDYFGRAFDDGILRALHGAGFETDVFAPGGARPQTLYPGVRRLEVEYRRSWLQSHLRLGRSYDLLLGTADIPMAFAGALAAVARRPTVVACDEIFIGGYEGDARSYWKSLTRAAMRRAELTVITDLVRVPLQREYASLPPDHEFIQYPTCFSEPFRDDSRAAARRQLGIGDEEFVVSFTGAFSTANGADWVLRLLDAMPDVRAMIQTAGRPDAVLDAFLTRLHREGRAIYLPDRLEYRESMELTAAADAGLALYLSPKPQFQHMGVSSQKLCAYLRLGIPVVVTRQDSFAFIDRFRCGEQVNGEEELLQALVRIRAERETYALHATRALDEHVRPVERLRELTARFAELS